MDEVLLEEILQRYGLTPAAFLPTQKGYRNQSHPVVLKDGSRVNLILYKNERGILKKIRAANEVSNFMARQGIPARHQYDPRIMYLQGGRNRRYAALYAYLPGSTIPWEAYTMEHLKELGSAMSQMHLLLRDFPATAPLEDVAEVCTVLTKQMATYFNDSGVKKALATKLGLHLASDPVRHYETLLLRSRELPGRQSLHMDFVRGNVLFDENAHITGIVDFEKTAMGHPIFDVARTLAFLIIDCKYKSEEKVRKYFLTSGYNKRGPARLQKIVDGGSDLLDELVGFFLLHDMYKFLAHNPYEFLPENEHFMRTRAWLVNRGIIDGRI